jgi:hypothetical protein
MFMLLNMFGMNIQLRCLGYRVCLNGYTEDSQRLNHPVVLPKTVNSITIQFEWLRRRQSTAQPSKLNGYAEDSQRHNHST